MLWKKSNRYRNNDSDDSQNTVMEECESKTSSKENQNNPPGNQLYFYSDVNRESIFILNRQIVELTKHIKTIQLHYNFAVPAIDLFISSDGGEVFSALAAVDKIKNNSIPIHSHCEGIVASASTLLSVVCKHRTISKNSAMLLHAVSGFLWGNYMQISDEKQNFDLIMKIIKRVYLEHTKFKEKDLDDLMKHDLYLEAKDCLRYGLVDSID